MDLLFRLRARHRRRDREPRPAQASPPHPLNLTVPVKIFTKRIGQRLLWPLVQQRQLPKRFTSIKS
jgi:hypothetical protein